MSTEHIILSKTSGNKFLIPHTRIETLSDRFTRCAMVGTWRVLAVDWCLWLHDWPFLGDPSTCAE